MEDYIRNEDKLKTQSLSYQEMLQSQLKLKIRNQLHDKEQFDNSKINCSIYISNKINKLHRGRVINTLTGIFLNSEYQNRLAIRLNSIFDECINDFRILTKDKL